jgi:hypothetical protein
VRTRSLLEFLYGARGALLQALNVMALSLVTAGLLRARLTVAASTCAAWALAASLIESAQHPAVVDRLLLWAEISSFPSRLLDSTLGLFWNARFAWSEVIASLVGGAAAFLIVRRQARRARSDASALR